MSLKHILTIGLVLGLSPLAVSAQPATTADAPVRSPVQGDPVVKPTVHHRTRAAAMARADKQPPGTENGNQPDRAAAGGGAR